MTNDEKLLRKYEALLDAHHLAHPLMKAERHRALFALLAAYDSIELSAPSMAAGGLGGAQQLKSIDEGLAQAVRWLHPARPLDVVGPIDDELINTAGDFLFEAARYVNIADFHRMYGRGLATIAVDEASKTVRFMSSAAGSDVLSGFGEDVAVARRREKERTSGGTRALWEAAAEEVVNNERGLGFGLIAIADHATLGGPALSAFAEHVMSDDDPDLSLDLDLAGFSGHEFRRFWKAISCWSQAVRALWAMRVRLSMEHQQPMPQEPIQSIEKNEFIRAVSGLSFLSAAQVSAIVDRLTYDRRTVSADIWQQPLFVDTHVTWSPRLIVHSKYWRNLLKLMSRTKSLKNLTATLIGTRERPLLLRVGAWLASLGYQFKIGTPVTAAGKQGEVDLLAYNPTFPAEVLVLEGKALLGVDEINEVDAATKELMHAQDQARAVREILDNMRVQEKKGLFAFVDWDQVQDVYLVVTTPGTDPNEAFSHAEVPALSFESLQHRISSSDASRPRSLWEACRRREWLAHLDQLPETYGTVKVGDIRYELPAVLTDSENEE